MLNQIKPRMQRLFESVEASYREQILELAPESDRLLDVGCHDGEWTAAVAKAARATAVSGIESVEAAADQARARGYDVRAGDLEERWPFDDDSFDLVHANQVIEHVKRLDHFVEETSRVLAPGGTALICTENLASWHNVGALLLGMQPFSYTNISKKGAIGNRFALHVDDEAGQGPGESWQHIHVVTMEALRGIFEAHGFTVHAMFGSGYYPAVGRAADALARRDPRHAHFIGIVAQQ